MTSTKHCRWSVTEDIVPLILLGLGRYGKRLKRMYELGEHKKILSMVVNPSGFSDWREFFLAYQCQHLLRKYPLLRTGINLQSVALEKFLLSEDRCRAMNAKLSRSGMGLSFSERSVFETARGEVKRILGHFDWDACLPFFAHGPGAAVGLPRERGHPWYKFGESTPTVTGECLALVRTMCGFSDTWKQAYGERPTVNLVDASKVTTVPKDARGDRTIAIEPLWNMYFQKGIGGLIRSRLRRSGCNLNDQTVNQELARVGSVSGSLSTIDLSSASDSIARVLVERLLPDDWLAALNMTRTSRALLPCGEKTFLQKFSSMGNGYTFELESLIFLAVGRAILKLHGKSDRVVSVYGDDIVIDADCALPLIAFLDAIGFKTNIDKTFVDGPFRESCGKHYFLGRDVTPFFLKRRISDVEDLFYVLNSIKRVAFRFLGVGYGLDGRFEWAYRSIYNLLPQRYRGFSIPDGVGDTGLLRDLDEVCPRPRRASGYVEGFHTRCLIRRFSERRADEYPALLWKLPYRHGVVQGSPLDLKQPHGLTVPTPRYKLVTVKLLVPRWSALGPWVSLL